MERGGERERERGREREGKKRDRGRENKNKRERAHNATILCMFAINYLIHNVV